MKKEKQRKTNKPCQAHPLWSHFPPHQLISWTMQKLPADFIWSFWHSSHNCFLNCHRHHYHRAPTLRQSISCVVICRSRLRPCLPSKNYTHILWLFVVFYIFTIFSLVLFSQISLYLHMMSQKNYIIICHISPRYLQIFQQNFYWPYFLTFHDMPQQYLHTNLPYKCTIFAHIYLFVQPIVFLKNNRFYFQQTTWTNPHLMKRKYLGFWGAF